MGYVIVFLLGGLIGTVFMALFRMSSAEDKKVEVVYADEPIERLAVRYKELTRPVLDLHYTFPIHKEDFDTLRCNCPEVLQNMILDGLTEQLVSALNIEIHKDYRRMEYVVDGSIYVVKGTGIEEIDHNDRRRSD